MICASALLGCSAEHGAPAIVDPTPVPPVTAATPPLQVATVQITTTNSAPITTTETYVPGAFAILGVKGDTINSGTLEIKGRGTSTWTMPKKPYKLKLTSSTAIVGMPANKHWVLLANYSDKTLLRNEIAFELSRQLGFAWTPRSQIVSVKLNGTYQGVYELVEHVRIAPERVNIPSLKITDTSAANISGGYLLEVDERSSEAFCFRSTATPMTFCLNDPETLNDAGWEKQRAYIKRYIAQTDSAIFGANFKDAQLGYAAYIDVETAVNYYLLQEIFRNVDGNLRLSTFLYKQRGGKLAFGPVWDFDIAMGNVNYGDADKTAGWYIRTAPWFRRMFEDPAFAARVKARWLELRQRGTLDALVNMVFSSGDAMMTVQAENFNRWPILNTYVWPNRVVTGSYVGELLALKNWLSDRIVWMGAQFAQ